MNYLSDKSQEEFSAKCFRDLLPPDSDVWDYIKITEKLDYSKFDAYYSGEGQVPLDPKLMMRTILYGFNHRMTSIRAIECACRNDLRFIVISGNRQPDRRTLDRFLIRHEDAIKDFFKQIVELCKKEDLIGLKRIAVDGSRFKAQTKPRGVKYGKMDQVLEKLNFMLEVFKASEVEDIKHEIEILEKKIDQIEKAKEKIETEYDKQTSNSSSRTIDKKQRSLEDIDALPLSHKSCSKGFFFGYNCQLAVDESSQIIVDQFVHDSATEYQALPLLLNNIKQTFNKSPDELLADLGYKSLENIVYLSRENVKPIIATKSNEYSADGGLEPVEYIYYDEKEDTYLCPSGAELGFYNKNEKKGRIELKFKQSECDNCFMKKECPLANKKTIAVPKGEKLHTYQEYVQATREEEFIESYRKRKHIVEPVFGNLKNKGMKIYRKGKAKVEVWFSIACSAHNIEKLVRKEVENGIFCFFNSIKRILTSNLLFYKTI